MGSLSCVAQWPFQPATVPDEMNTRSNRETLRIRKMDCKFIRELNIEYQQPCNVTVKAVPAFSIYLSILMGPAFSICLSRSVGTELAAALRFCATFAVEIVGIDDGLSIKKSRSSRTLTLAPSMSMVVALANCITAAETPHIPLQSQEVPA